MSNVLDLDILKPDPIIIKLDGKEIDISFIPCGITFEVDEIVRELGKRDIEKLKEENVARNEEIKTAFNLSIKLCALVCSWRFPYMTDEWFNNNVDARQVNIIVTHVKKALIESYKGIERYGKN